MQLDTASATAASIGAITCYVYTQLKRVAAEIIIEYAQHAYQSNVRNNQSINSAYSIA